MRLLPLLAGVPSVTKNPPEYDDADMSATTPPSVGAVYLNQTLALVAGAPQLAFRAASCASVVAPVVSWVMVVGRDVTAVAVAAVSLGTGAAEAAVAMTGRSSSPAVAADKVERNNFMFPPAVKRPPVGPCRA